MAPGVGRLLDDGYGAVGVARCDQRSDAVTGWPDFRGRSHVLVAEPGWEEVGDGMVEWIERNVPADDAP